MPILELLDALWTRTSRQRVQFDNEAQGLIEKGQTLSLWALKVLAESLKFIRTQKAVISINTITSIKAKVITPPSISLANFGVDYKVHIVKLIEGSCQCGRFQDTGLPCSHAITVIRATNRDINKYVKF